MKLRTRDFVSTSLIVLLAACLVAYLLDGRIALVEGTRGMAGLALIRGRDRSWFVLSATGLSVLLTALLLQQVAEGLGWLAG